MGPENSGGPFVAYIDGQPIEIRGPLPEFTIYDISEDMKTAREILEAWVDIRITMEVAAEGIREFFHTMELATAVHLARIFEPDLARRYIRTKKKRTRKKYEKRIMVWFREVLG